MAAIRYDVLKAEYQQQAAYGVSLNPSIFANGDWTSLYGTTTHPKRFPYALSRGPLQDAAGSNAIWNITNVTRSNRRYNYMTNTYAVTASQDREVQEKVYSYFPKENKTGDAESDIYKLLMTNELDIELSDEDYANYMIWHRGLGVPDARDLDNNKVKKGKQLFNEIGCAH